MGQLLYNLSGRLLAHSRRFVALRRAGRKGENKPFLRSSPPFDFSLSPPCILPRTPAPGCSPRAEMRLINGRVPPSRYPLWQIRGTRQVWADLYLSQPFCSCDLSALHWSVSWFANRKAVRATQSAGTETIRPGTWRGPLQNRQIDKHEHFFQKEVLFLPQMCLNTIPTFTGSSYNFPWSIELDL